MAKTAKGSDKYLTGGTHDAPAGLYGLAADSSAIDIGRSGAGSGTGGNRPDNEAPAPGGQTSSGTPSKSSGR